MAPKKRTTRASPATTSTTTIPVTNAEFKALIDQGVADALAACDADRSMNGDDSHNSGMGSRRTERTAWECTYTDFLKCQPLNFKGTEGVVGLMQWFEKMETVFHISNYIVACQIKFATCTLQGISLTWWNSHIKTVTHDVAYAMTWKTLKKMMTNKYYPRGKIKKLEIEIIDEIEKYGGGLPDMIHGSVIASKPTTMHDAIEFVTELMDKKIITLIERQVENKRKLDNNNQANQQHPKKKGVAIAYTAGFGKRKESPPATNNQRNLTYYECVNQGHYRSDCPKLKNQNHGHQAGGTGARGMVHAIGGGETNQDLNDMEDDINA
nr:hypothetical protein [Tanacetum cinerariifolium]